MERRHNTRYAAALAAAAAALPGNSDSEKTVKKEKERETPEPEDINDSSPLMTKQEMYEIFQSWALKTYGDSAKTKTVTRRKYNRILKILKGEENNNAENSKFRFWVKAKAFRIGPPPHQLIEGTRPDQVLYVPCSRLGSSVGKGETVYKKVAVVENFFDIIYGVHVEMDGRGGKHAGQKRTYKAIAKTYAFLPREAVTHFLMSCADCQKRMHLTAEGTTNNNGRKGGCQGNRERGDSSESSSPESGSPSHEECSATPEIAADIDYSLPITTTYLKRMRSLGFSDEDALNPEREQVEASIECASTTEAPSNGNVGNQNKTGDGHDADSQSETLMDTSEPSCENQGVAPQDKDSNMNYEKKENENVHWSGVEPINMIRSSSSRDFATPGYPLDHSYDRNSNPCNGAVQPETSIENDDTLLTTKDEDDEEEDDDSDKIDTNKYDPDRLKAFNMFVRLFVDENLDRMVPISRQPKEKIQAIIESCARQFPEFVERARKRIRTYLKSCRRAKRTRDQNGLELVELTHSRSTCNSVSNSQADSDIPRSSIIMNKSHQALNQDSQLHTQLTQSAHHSLLGSGRNIAHPGTSSSTRVLMVNGGAITSQPSNSSLLSDTIYRGTSQSSFHCTAFPQHSNNSQLSSSSTTMTNGPTDLSMKRTTTAKYSLNPSEVNAVKQLVAGYRESAVFLLRSADELEQLLFQQN
ncbi:nucleolar protein 4-like isoform X2 [Tachypleus tridentatus]|uniref:nucleolar protein 4-like isoform X2 n=1 Tax=Tachypleus tridentatus TaxID=6853 RepID=UPI003FD00723